MIAISLDGCIIRKSRNLRGMREYASVSTVSRVTANPFLGGGGQLIVMYYNGAICQTDFLDYTALLEFLFSRISWFTASWHIAAPSAENRRSIDAHRMLSAKIAIAKGY